jgi:dimethylhistidine N-methyltransferase
VRALIITPAPPGSRGGNRTTALRWAKRLRELGLSVQVRTEWSRADACDLVIALHATKSAAQALRALRERPDLPLVVGLAGTDVYGALRGGDDVAAAGWAVLRAAARVIALNPLAARTLPDDIAAKTRTIIQSARPAPPPHPSDMPDAFDACVIAHLRPVKDPFRVAAAARLVPPESRLRVLHVGRAITEDLARAARAEERHNRRYVWLDERPRAQALGLLARSKVLVLASEAEGGANVISEAIAAGVPVIASRIDGSVGILGADWPAYFPVGDTAALAALLDRVERDRGFHQHLLRRTRALAPLVDPARERAAFAELLDELYPERAAFAADVRGGLHASPKHLPCRWFYDREGSLLFEAICEVPEYYIPAAETEILAAHADAIAAATTAGTVIVELGSGNARKTRLLLEAFLRRAPRLRYVPIDISAAALDDCAQALRADYPGLEVAPVRAEYNDGLQALATAAGPAPRLVLWLGSNIGNFTRPEATRFLGQVRAQLRPEDRMLVGVDLRKDPAVLAAAYDDSRGVTARFNLNLLARIDRELGGRFAAAGFRHEVSYETVEGRVRMFLVSPRAQRVHIAGLGLDVDFASGERIHTEDSYKYSLEEIQGVAEAAGLGVERLLLDRQRRFCDALLRPLTVRPRS